MFKKLSYVSMFAFFIVAIAVLTLKERVSIGPIVLALTIMPLSGLYFAKRHFNQPSQT